MPGEIFHTVPCKAFLEIIKDDEYSYDLLYNGNLIDSETKKIACNGEAELVVRQGGERRVYFVRPSVHP